MSVQNKINFGSYKSFLSELEYNYPVNFPVMYFIKTWQEYLNNLKREVLENLILFNNENKATYLNKLLFDLELETKHTHTSIKDINIWLHLYDITLKEVIKGKKTENKLLSYLTSELVGFDEKNQPNYNTHKEQIQNDFYNYFYGHAINEAIDFINDQFESHKKPEITEKKKLKTNLSVPQLALLFKELNKLKPNVFDIKTNTELYQFISDSFTTKQSTGDISTKSIKNKFEDPNQKTIDFWANKFRKMLTNVRN